ncbi:hypothetical protein E1287_25685 [Actinomadura sp. KC06]|uniref:DUF6292 family protein n=1 Tax=Actinomadura sp. KC06 TaxID=2530369 RepID=UPI0010435FFF|nr:DUF6292 family protein [Actinomadura sp. KC06]TDD31655.1 hypothetical protein E1287_25685 [Actinomadura sp. KC06]
MEITRDQVRGYITAVTEALKDAGHKLDDPFIDDQDDVVITIMIAIPDAFTDEQERLGLALLWEPRHGWDAGFVSHRALNTVRITMHTDLRLGVVPAPEVIVRAVAAIVANGDPKEGRVVPGTAEQLAAYVGGEAPVSRQAQLAGQVRSIAQDLDDELRDRLGWDEAHEIRDRLLAVADGGTA